MQFSELLRKLRKLNLDQVGRVTWHNNQDSTIMIGNPEEIVFPFQFQCHTLYAPVGVDDFLVSEEEIAALLRRFRVPREKFDQN